MASHEGEAAGVPGVRLSSATHPNPEALDRAIAEQLARARVDVVFLAGYMKKLGPAGLAVISHEAVPS